MSKKNKVYFVSNSLELESELPRELALFGYITKVLPADEEALLQVIRDDCPDVVVIDAFLPQLDVAKIMRECHSLPNPPKFIIRSTHRNTNLQQQLEGSGYYLLLPVDPTVISQKIEELCDPNSHSLKMQISNTLHTIGVPANIQGYHYLRDSIMLTIKNNEAVLAITKLIYPDVAKMYDKTPAQVERTIRHAIEKTWELNDTERLNQYFCRTSHHRPTNSEFIATVADKIRLGLR